MATTLLATDATATGPRSTLATAKSEVAHAPHAKREKALGHITGNELLPSATFVMAVQRGRRSFVTPYVDLFNSLSDYKESVSAGFVEPSHLIEMAFLVQPAFYTAAAMCIVTGVSIPGIFDTEHGTTKTWVLDLLTNHDYSFDSTSGKFGLTHDAFDTAADDIIKKAMRTVSISSIEVELEKWKGVSPDLVTTSFVEQAMKQWLATSVVYALSATPIVGALFASQSFPDTSITGSTPVSDAGVITAGQFSFPNFAGKDVEAQDALYMFPPEPVNATGNSKLPMQARGVLTMARSPPYAARAGERFDFLYPMGGKEFYHHFGPFLSRSLLDELASHTIVGYAMARASSDDPERPLQISLKTHQASRPRYA